MSKNDDKIKEVLEQIEKSKKELGVKPRLMLKSNGLVKLASSTVNINTLNSLEACVEVATEVVKNLNGTHHAANKLGLDPDPYTEGFENQFEDIKLRVSILQYEAKSKKLQAMEQRLKDLRSEDAKTSDAISDILKDL